MRQHRFTVFSPLLFPFLVAASLGLCAQPAATPGNYSGLTRAQKEEFLLKAKIVKYQAAKKGITNTLRATLSDGTTTHDASVTVQIPMVVDFRGGGGWARAGAGDGNEPQSVNS